MAERVLPQKDSDFANVFQGNNPRTFCFVYLKILRAEY